MQNSNKSRKSNVGNITFKLASKAVEDRDRVPVDDRRNKRKQESVDYSNETETKANEPSPTLVLRGLNFLTTEQTVFNYDSC